MLKDKIEEARENLRNKFQTIPTLKIYSSNVPISEKIKKIKELPIGLRGAASLVYDALEGHSSKQYEVYASQATIAKEVGYSREWVNYIIQMLTKIGLITKLRRGLNMSNIYTLIVKKEMCAYLEKINSLQVYGKQYKNKSVKKDTFNDYEQRDYDFAALEKGLLGDDTGESG